MNEPKPEPIKPHGFLALGVILFGGFVGCLWMAFVVESSELRNLFGGGAVVTGLGQVLAWVGKQIGKSTESKVDASTQMLLEAIKILTEQVKQLSKQHGELMADFAQMRREIASLQTAEEDSDTEFADVLGVIDNHGAQIVKIHEHLKAADPAFEPGLVRQRDLSKTKKR